MPSLVDVSQAMPSSYHRSSSSSDDAMPSIIQLNVGGKRYTTSMATLTSCRDSMLGAMFRGGMGVAKDAEDCYFIDRDGKLFRHILNFLRSGTLHVSSLEVLEALREEADYFCLQDLVDYVTAELNRRRSPRKERRRFNSRSKVRTISLDSDFELGSGLSNPHASHNHSLISGFTAGATIREDSTFLEEEEEPYEIIEDDGAERSSQEQGGVKVEFEQELFSVDPDF